MSVTRKSLGVLLLCALTLCVRSVEENEDSQCWPVLYASFPGNNLDDQPITGLKNAGECCDRCQSYKGDKKCVAYSFVRSDCDTECWLKSAVDCYVPSVKAESGIAYKIIEGEIQEIEGELQLAVEPYFVTWKRYYKRVYDAWPTAFKVKVPDWLKYRMPESCDASKSNMNAKIVSLTADPLPIFNLKCPEDCKKACYDYQAMSGRYSCVAYNFVYAKEVSECWLLTSSKLSTLKPGYASGESGRPGTEVGKPPVKYQELIKLYQDLIRDSGKCIIDESKFANNTLFKQP